MTETAVRKHRHEFSALWWHLGQYGDQSVHVHGCFTEGCWRVVVGPGRECDGDPRTHYRATLSEGGFVRKTRPANYEEPVHMKRRFTIEAELDPSKFDRMLDPDPEAWGVHDFVEAFQEGAITDNCSMVGNEEIQ